MKRVLFVCTSGKDRSPALVEYFKEIAPQHEYRCAGINTYFCSKKGTHLIDEADIEWADLIVYAEQVHFDVVTKIFQLVVYRPSPNDLVQIIKCKREYVILNCGDYQQGCIGEDYLTKAQLKLQSYLA